jgi:hypothetical protein
MMQILAWLSWDAVSTIATVVAVGIAAYQIRLSRRDSNSRAVLDHLRIIGDKALRAGAFRVEDAQRDVVEWYNGTQTQRSDGAEALLDLLNALDLLALAVKAGTVDEKRAGEHIRTLVTPGLVSPAFLNELRSCCGDEHVYEDLDRYVAQLRPKPKALAGGK